MSTFIKLIAFLMGAIYILFAYFQLNDQDPEIWIPIYVLASLLSFGVFFQLGSRYLFIFLGLAYLAGAYIYIPNEWHGLAYQEEFVGDIELARESLGLLICALNMFFYAWVLRK